jgi:cephalosporin-C deacetylase-like acetyl esterase
MSDRRTFLQQVAAMPFATSMPFAISISAAAAEAPRVRGYGEDMPDMLLAYLQNKTNALAAEWDRKRAQIRTPAALEERNRFVRARCTEMIHGLPERTPLNAVIVRVLEREGYRIESLMFESRPNFWVTASLYVPAARGPFPGIISPCGHYATARLYPSYQFMYQSLVKEGFVVLAYDPVGQGERRYYWDPATNQNEIGGPVTWEHSLPGQLLLLIGQDLTHYRIWDGMRAIDYLLTRPEVDPKRIGCCGHSGGGTLTTFIAALDERVKCVVAHEGGMHRRWPVHIRPESSLGTGDTEQHFFPAAIYGVDGGDLNAAIAPRPLLSTIEHFNPGYNAVTAEVRARYELMGAPEKFQTVEADDPHDMTMRLRLANTNWFCRWFQNRKGPETEPDFRLETAAEINCLPNGSIRYSRRGDTIYSIIEREQSSLPPRLSMPPAEMQQSIRTLLRFHRSDHPLGVRALTTTARRHYRIEKIEFLSEPGIYIPTWVFVPDRRGDDRSAILYVSEQGKEADGLEFDVLEGLALQGNLVVSVDVRGIGETKPRHGESGQGAYRHVGDAETTMQYMAWEMNESLTGMRVQDVMRSVDYSLSRTDVNGAGVRAIGKGMGSLWVLFAAALDARVTRAVCHGGLLSYRTLARSDRYLHGASVMLPDVLKHFDLPQAASAVAGRRLVMLDPLDAMKSRVNLETARRTYEAAAQVATRRQDVSLAEQYLQLLG